MQHLGLGNEYQPEEEKTHQPVDFCKSIPIQQTGDPFAFQQGVDELAEHSPRNLQEVGRIVRFETELKGASKISRSAIE